MRFLPLREPNDDANKGADTDDKSKGNPPKDENKDAPPPAAAKSEVDVKAIKAKAAEDARKKLLEELGVEDPQAAKDAIAAKADADAKKLSDQERLTKAVGAETTKREKAEREASAATARANELQTEVTLLKAGVLADEVEVAGILFGKAKAAAGEEFDADAYLKDLREKKPYLFTKAEAPAAKPAATTAPRVPAKKDGSPDEKPVDVSKMSPAEFAEWERKHVPALDPFAAFKN